jgi:hypothetical protein
VYRKVQVTPSGVESTLIDLDKPNSIILGRTYGASENLSLSQRGKRDRLMEQAPEPIKPLLYTYDEIDTVWEMENPLGCAVESNMSILYCIIK